MSYNTCSNLRRFNAARTRLSTLEAPGSMAHVLTPRGPRVLAELGGDNSPVQMIANEDQFRPRMMIVGMGMWCRMLGLVVMVVVRRHILIHGTANASSDALYQQMPCFTLKVGKPFDAQHGLLLGN